MEPSRKTHHRKERLGAHMHRDALEPINYSIIYEATAHATSCAIVI